MPRKGQTKAQAIGRETILAAVRTNGSKAAAARALGISRQTLSKILKDDPAIEREAKRQRIEEACKALELATQYAPYILQRLWQQANDPELPPGTQQNAMRILLDCNKDRGRALMQLMQLDIMQQRADDAPWN